MSSLPGRPALLVFYLAASLAAFGGIYSWALAPLLLGGLLLAIVAAYGRRVPSAGAARAVNSKGAASALNSQRAASALTSERAASALHPEGAASALYSECAASALNPEGAASAAPDTKHLDISIAALVIAVALQLVPVPMAVRAWLSPHAAAIDALRIDAAIRDVAVAPLSTDPWATAGALVLVVAVALTYLAARRIFSMGGVRFVCGAVSVVAAIAAIGALVQRALAPRLIYGFWQPLDPGGQPFGPVVNRNHFAAWLLMASALTAGYLVARVSRRAHDVRGWPSIKRLLVSLAQSSVAWTGALWLVITVTILAAQSRSAFVGLAVATMTMMRGVTGTWRSVLLAAGAMLLCAMSLLAMGESTATRMAERFADTLEGTEIGRMVIWRETLPMLSDFALAGVGAGAFGRAMVGYQQTRMFVPHLGTEWFFNHAHNHYLQLAVEGGALLTLPFVVTIVLFVRVAARRLREDAGELRAVRLGAIAGLAGVAAQSVWEVPLTMPAAALFAAVLAALATYRRGGN